MLVINVKLLYIYMHNRYIHTHTYICIIGIHCKVQWEPRRWESKLESGQAAERK